MQKKRIKAGLVLGEFGEKHKIEVKEEEIKSEIQKQIRMMPGQEKMVMEYYQKNPSAADSLKGSIYEEKIITAIKNESKIEKKSITIAEAEKIILEQNKKSIVDKKSEENQKKSPSKSKVKEKVKISKNVKKLDKKKIKKVSKK